MNEKTDKIKELIEQGKTYDEISKILYIHRSTVYKYSKNSEAKKKTKKEHITRLILDGKNLKEIEEIVGANKAYIIEIKEDIESKKNIDLDDRSILKAIREEEVNKINKEHEEMKKQGNKYNEEQLEHEKQMMEEKYPYIFKFTKI